MFTKKIMLLIMALNFSSCFGARMEELNPGQLLLSQLNVFPEGTSQYHGRISFLDENNNQTALMHVVFSRDDSLDSVIAQLPETVSNFCWRGKIEYLVYLVQGGIESGAVS